MHILGEDEFACSISVHVFLLLGRTDVLILPRLRKGRKLERCNSDFRGGSQFTPGVNKRNSTRGTCLGLGFASPQLVWRKTTVFLRKYGRNRGAWEKG